MKRVILSDIAAFITGASFATWISFGQATALIVTILVGVYTLIEKHHNIRLLRAKRREMKQP